MSMGTLGHETHLTLYIPEGMFDSHAFGTALML